ncbi:MAG: hypothetical protein NW226_10720 [Microscillaceae bacterium]|nr:hypothetical protein [Microscillaceae bacterium]
MKKLPKTQYLIPINLKAISNTARAYRFVLRLLAQARRRTNQEAYF